MSSDIETYLRRYVKRLTNQAAKEEWSNIQKGEIEAVFNYRLNHVKEVVRLAEAITECLNINIEILEMAAWLHDIAKPGIDGPEQHGRKSSRKARKILSEMDIEETQIRKVCDIIEKHVGLTLQQPLEPLEAQLLWEADKLSKLGATGIIHYIINGIRLKPGMSLQDISEDLSDFMSLAEEIADSMHTEKAKEIASKRFNTMKSFVKSLEQEVQRREK